MPESREGPDVEKLVAELRRKVEDRYRSGEYPAGLEDQLASHFDALSGRPVPPPTALARQQAAVDEAAKFAADRIPYMSSLPLGSSIHRLIGKLTRRQTEGVLMQMRAYTEALRLLLLALIDRAGEAPTERQARLEAVNDLQTRRLLLLGEPTSSAAQRAHAIADLLVGSAPVVDLDSGGGLLLAALKGRGIEAMGVDADPDLVAVLTEKGLRAVTSDRLSYLESMEDSSVGAVVARHEPGRSRPAGLLEVIGLAHRKLRPGGRFIIDVGSGRAGTQTNGSRSAPVPSDLLLAIVERAGFTNGEIAMWPAAEEAKRLERVPESADLQPELTAALNRNWERLERLTEQPGEFAVIAFR